MEKSLAVKVITYLFYALFIFSIVFAVIFATDALGKGDLLIKWSYVLSFVSIGGTLIFMIKDMFRSKKTMIMSGAIIVFGGLLIGVSLGMSTDAPIVNAVGEVIANGKTAKISDATLYLLYILLGLSFVSLLYTEISKVFK